jgi:uncharacterized paraquat-inducible protein A
MSQSLTCPRCSTALRVPTDAGDQSATCPRCLAEIPIAARQGVTTAPANVPELERVGAQWRFCPNCEEPLWRQGRHGRERSIELDVRRDNTALTVCMILLAVLGGTGLALTLLAAAAVQAADGKPDMPISIALIVLFVSGLIGSLTVVLRKDKPSTGRAIGLAAFRSLTIAGILFLLFCLACVAVGIYVFVACLTGPGPSFH